MLQGLCFAPPPLALGISSTTMFFPKRLLPLSSTHTIGLHLFSECRYMTALSARASSATGSSKNRLSSRKKLILYSKPGCCLCDTLKEKLDAVFLMGGEDSLSDVQFEIRNISTKTEWEAAYQYEIPVLARVNEDNSETVLPRLSPRLSIELIHRKLSAALR